MEGLTLSLLLFDLGENELLKSNIKELVCTGLFDEKKLQLINKYLNRFKEEDLNETYAWVGSYLIENNQLSLAHK
jgi:hypothetical protein